MARLDGKVALVTGAGRGIGRACAERLAEAGAAVIVSDRLEADCTDVLDAIGKAGCAASALALDVTDEEAWRQAMDAVVKRHGRLDILVNNAGVAITAPVTEMSLANFKRQMAVNVEGTFLGCKHAIPIMRRGGGGSIVNLSSTAGMRGSPGMSGYSASKGAVRLFTKAVAMEHAKDGIRANSVHPGITETDIWRGMTNLSTAPGAIPDLDTMASRVVPLGRKGMPMDIAGGVLWLASEESSYVTGIELVIDGGMTGR